MAWHGMAWHGMARICFSVSNSIACYFKKKELLIHVRRDAYTKENRTAYLGQCKQVHLLALLALLALLLALLALLLALLALLLALLALLMALLWTPMSFEGNVACLILGQKKQVHLLALLALALAVDRRQQLLWTPLQPLLPLLPLQPLLQDQPNWPFGWTFCTKCVSWMVPRLGCLDASAYCSRCFEQFDARSLTTMWPKCTKHQCGNLQAVRTAAHCCRPLLHVGASCWL
jgi:hypothetical protein